MTTSMQPGFPQPAFPQLGLSWPASDGVVTGHRPSRPLNQVQGGGGRVGTATELPAVLRELRVDPDPIIASTGLEPRLLDDGENPMPSAAFGRLLSASVARTGCPHIGLRLGARARASCFGVVGLLMHHCPTVADALACFIEHGHLYHTELTSMLEVRNGVAVLRYGASPADREGADQIVDSALAAGFRLMQAFCGPDWRPTEVLIAHPAADDGSAPSQLFEAPVRFDEEETALVFPAQWLRHLVPGADPRFRHLLQQQVGGLKHRHDEPLSNQLRRSLHTLLLRKGCSAERTAALFAMHRRTMSRRLRAEGQSFQSLVDEVRYDLARHLLANGSTPLSNVAAALGYSEASAFTRAFKRWSGSAPKAWKRVHWRAQTAHNAPVTVSDLHWIGAHNSSPARTFTPNPRLHGACAGPQMS